mmetsp:Transcript_65625/g.173779  ORF Transcript_65625/g.173779 Transcript_65625/m.173779 type:complete len:239 (-) Transcript_65625:375-1091(-)
MSAQDDEAIPKKELRGAGRSLRGETLTIQRCDRSRPQASNSSQSPMPGHHPIQFVSCSVKKPSLLHSNSRLVDPDVFRGHLVDRLKRTVLDAHSSQAAGSPAGSGDGVLDVRSVGRFRVSELLCPSDQKLHAHEETLGSLNLCEHESDLSSQELNDNDVLGVCSIVVRIVVHSSSAVPLFVLLHDPVHFGHRCQWELDDAPTALVHLQSTQVLHELTVHTGVFRVGCQLRHVDPAMKI